MNVPLPDVAASVDVAPLRDWMNARRDDLVDDLVELVNTETPSDDHALLDKGLAHVENWICSRLGEPDRRTRHDDEDEAYGAAVVLDFDGPGQGRLVGLGHYDTVFDAGTVAQRPAKVDGDRVTGPGVFDMKGGLVQLVWALRALDQLEVPRPSVRLVINGDEEIGSPFSRPLIEDAVRDADAVLVFEGSVDGAVKTARKGVGLFQVHATGIEAHAGLEPEAGASAIGEIARVVTTLHDASDLAAGTTINVGVLHGGRRANVVAGAAEARLDIRVATPEEHDRVDRLLRSLAPVDERVRLDLHGDWNRPVMTRSEGVVAMYDLARAVAGRLGIDLAEASVGGASDGNFVSALGIPVLDGFGAVGAGAHAEHEWVSVTGMLERAALAAGVIASFGAGTRARA